MKSGLILFLLAAPLVSAAEPTPLETKVREIAAAHKGKVTVAVKNLATGEGFAIDGDEVMQTASLIKLAIMMEAYRQADAKKADLGKMLTLTKDDKVQGSGILTSHFSDGATFPLRDAVRLMIVFSDNTATNMVLDQIGIKNVNAMTKELGMSETRINAKVFKGSTTSVDPERTKKYSLGSTTANDCVKILELIHTDKAASADSCKEMLKQLKACDDKDKLVRLLPAGTVVAHKTGSTNQVRTDAGIIYIPDPKDAKVKIPVAVAVLTNENEDTRWTKDNAGEVTNAKIGLAVFEAYSKK
jgi:beta-lactamase class A